MSLITISGITIKCNKCGEFLATDVMDLHPDTADGRKLLQEELEENGWKTEGEEHLCDVCQENKEEENEN